MTIQNPTGPDFFSFSLMRPSLSLSLTLTIVLVLVLDYTEYYYY